MSSSDKDWVTAVVEGEVSAYGKGKSKSKSKGKAKDKGKGKPNHKNGPTDGER